MGALNQYEYTQEQIERALQHIPPSSLDYQEWVNVGMAIKSYSLPFHLWDEWSRYDNRYKANEMQSKWQSFNGSGIEIGTLLKMAKENGFNERPQLHNYHENSPRKASDYESGKDKGKELEARTSDYSKELPQILSDTEQNKIIEFPKNRENKKDYEDTVDYLKAVFEPQERICLQLRSRRARTKDGFKFIPSDCGTNVRVSDLIKQLEDSKNVFETFNDGYNTEAGAWVCINPTDGEGRNFNNIIDYKNALIESDDAEMELTKQYSIMKSLRLPFRAITYSGNKSIHAVVRIDAKNAEEYKERVITLMDICLKNGLRVDKNNKNPSRLTRIAGVNRGNQSQKLIEVFTEPNKNAPEPCANYEEWIKWIENVQDDLPEFENAYDLLMDMPKLKPELIKGMLRKGHKMLFTGPSKSGKSFMMLNLCVSIASGGYFLNKFRCETGQVLYINLELDRASGIHRLKAIIDKMNISAQAMKNIEIWNLRGKTVPMDKLKDKIINRCLEKSFSAVIIDPIYKVITGDENSAQEMSKFCNLFDEIADKIGCSVIYCHHHSKGLQGHKNIMDRASGSGVFARDPDVIFDMTELVMTEEVRSRFFHQYSDFITDERARSEKLEELKSATAYRASLILREFASPEPFDLFFLYPVHEPDEFELLKDLYPEGINPLLKRKSTAEQREDNRQDKLDEAFEHFTELKGEVAMADVMDYLKASQKTVIRYVQESGNYFIFDGVILTKEQGRSIGLDPQADTQTNKETMIKFETAKAIEKLKANPWVKPTVQNLANELNISDKSVRRRIEKMDDYEIKDGLITDI